MLSLRSLTPALGLILILGASSCGNDFDPPSKLDSLRILALRADPSEARPGELIALDALTYVPAGSEPPPEGASPGGNASYAWRVCYLVSDLFGGEGPGGGSSPMGAASTERPPSHCFEIDQSVTLDELLASMAGGPPPDEGDGSSDGDAKDAALDLQDVAIDLGNERRAQMLAFPLPPFPAMPSFCTDLSNEERAEQGGREFWISGLRLMVTLRLSVAGETIYANKRVVIRPAADAIPEDQQGMPFKTPRLCENQSDAGYPCERNLNPAAPVLTTPNEEWSGEGALHLDPGQKVRLLPALPVEGDEQLYVAMKLCGEQIADPALQAVGGEYSRKEGRFYQWFSAGGDVLRGDSVLGEREGDRDSGWEAPNTVDEVQRSTLYVVVRDGRGGTSWSSLELIVAP